MTLFKMENRRNFGFSAENPTGTKGGGTRAKDCEKLSPCIQIQPGETVTLCDTDGPGMVTHMWFCLLYTSARQSAVLLKNNGVLPLKKEKKLRVAVIGPNADALYQQLGDYTPPLRDGVGVTCLIYTSRCV